MRKLGSLSVISILLLSIFNSPVYFSTLALAQVPQPTGTSAPPATPDTGGSKSSTGSTPDSSGSSGAATSGEPAGSGGKTPTTSEPTQEKERPPEGTASTSTCSSVPQPPVCGEKEGLKLVFDGNGCVIGYACESAPQGEVGATCPEVPAARLSCGSNEVLNKLVDDKGCVTGFNCISTSTKETVCPQVAPEKPSCEEGGVAPVFDKGCLISYTCVPKGCRQETDRSGFVKVICEQQRACPAVEQQDKLKSKCFNQGGNPVPFQDPNGCTFYDCRFDNREINTNPIGGYSKCPEPEEMERMINQCKETGLKPGVTFEGGCRIVKCSEDARPACYYVGDSEKQKIGNSCASKGLDVVRGVDNHGCAFYRCGESAKSACHSEVPAEAYKSCDAKGGEMVVKNDVNGCIVFSQCVAPGDETQIYVDPVDEIPETTKLLSLAVKLERLKIELMDLAGESEEIAKYYRSTGSLDEERYTRVSTMFEAAADKVDEIRAKIRENADTMTKDDLVEIKHDVKYIKEVVLKDILYLMLSDSEDVKETLEASRRVSGKDLTAEELESNVKSCGTDGSCFDRAIRSCKPVSFQPDGRRGPSVTIKGIEDGVCVLHFIMQSNDMVPPGYTKDTFYMECGIENYALGVKGPEDIVPYCEGPMSEFAKRFGGASDISGGDEFQEILEKEGGPGGCKEERECANYCIDNYEECKRWVKEHPAVGTMPTKEELKQMMAGEFEERRSGSQFSGPGGCKSPQECDRFCRSNPDECLKWCKENPQLCPGEREPEEFRRTGEFEGELERSRRAATQPFSRTPIQAPVSQESVQACVGCLNNGICDIGECSECVDCLRSERSITGEISRIGG